MILGIDRIVAWHELEPGRFYLEPNYKGEPRLFQCVQTSRDIDGERERKALYFAPQEEQKLWFAELTYNLPLVAMPDVHVRVDPPSINGSYGMSSLSAGMFLVKDNQALVTAHLGYRHWAMINLNTGRTVEGVMPTDWVSFSRWLLVVEESGEEIPIASFGE